MTLHVAILGSGNIGTDLMYKVIRNPALELAGVAGADPSSEGLARARALGVATSDRGAAPFLAEHPEVTVAFDATSAHAHVQHAPLLAARDIRCIDLTPAALGPAVVPDVNLDEHLDAPDANLVTCGAQATVPAVAAVRDAVDRVAAYVPGYHLATEPLVSDGLLTAFIEVEGAGDYLPRYAGNLDIMTSAAVRVAERYAERQTA